MKIGIFGDSFSGSNGPTSWTTLLHHEFGNAINHSEAGTSLFHAYKHFIKNYKDYDTIIFTITAPGRLYTDVPVDMCICNLFVVEHQLSMPNIETKMYYKHIKAAEQYYTYLQNDDYDNFVHDAIIEKVINLCQENNIKLIMFPCMFQNRTKNFDPYINCADKFNLGMVNELEREFYNIPHKGMHFEREDRLQNHISDENNFVLFNIVKRIIQGENIKIDITMFDPWPKTDVNVYYNMEEINKL